MSKGTVLMLCGPEYEDLEVWYPKLRLEEAGYAAPLAGIGEASYRGKHGYPATMDLQARDVHAAQHEHLGLGCPVDAHRPHEYQLPTRKSVLRKFEQRRLRTLLTQLAHPVKGRSLKR